MKNLFFSVKGLIGVSLVLTMIVLLTTTVSSKATVGTQFTVESHATGALGNVNLNMAAGGFVSVNVPGPGSYATYVSSQVVSVVIFGHIVNQQNVWTHIVLPNGKKVDARLTSGLIVIVDTQEVN